MKSSINEFLRDEEGQDLVEYSLLIALIALGAIAALGTLKNGITGLMNTVSTKLTTCSSTAGC